MSSTYSELKQAKDHRTTRDKESRLRNKRPYDPSSNLSYLEIAILEGVAQNSDLPKNADATAIQFCRQSGFIQRAWFNRERPWNITEEGARALRTALGK